MEDSILERSLVDLLLLGDVSAEAGEATLQEPALLDTAFLGYEDASALHLFPLS